MTNKFMQYLESKELSRIRMKIAVKIFWILLGIIFFACIAKIISFYFHYSHEAFYSFSESEKANLTILGQAGDYFGGILNPVFGLLTIILILRNSRREYLDAKHSKTAKDLETLREIIISGTKDLITRCAGTYFIDEVGNRFSFDSTLNANDLVATLRREYLGNLSVRLYSSQDIEMSKVEKWNTNELVKLRDIIEPVFRAHHEIIKLETHELVQNFFATKLNHLLGDLYLQQLIPKEIVELHEDLLDKALPYRTRFK